MCSPDYSSGEWTRTPYKHLDKRFSGHERALPPEPAGADAWRATTYGHGVLQTNPLGSALDRESSTCLIALVFGAQALRPRRPTRLATRAMCAGADAGLVFSDYLQGQKYPAGRRRARLERAEMRHRRRVLWPRLAVASMMELSHNPSHSLADLQGRLQSALGDAYHIERELGGGGMSRLFLATEASLHRQVVIQLLPPEFASEVSATRFRQEIEVAAHLQHTNILPVLTAGAKDDLLFYVMPFVSGESLRHRLTREGRLPLPDAMRILHEIADALAHAHAEGVIHRDIKPETILLLGSHAVLTDFGVARALAESRSGGRLTDTGLALGTPGYMSPEQAAGERHIDARADLYALAVVGYEMLAGFPPFAGPTAQAAIAAPLTATPKPLTDARPDTPPQVAHAIARAPAEDPNAPLPTAAEFRDAIGAAHPGAARPPISQRVRGAAAVTGAIVLAAVAVLALRPRARPALDPNLVAVAPFDVLDPKLELWHEGLVDVLSRNLDGARPLRTLSPTVVVRRWSGRADPTAAGDLGHRTGARLAVFGQLVATTADSVRLTATLFDVAAGRPGGGNALRGASARMDR